MSEKKNYVISVFSPIGGQGVSLIASQLVHQLAAHGPSCLLDLNLDFSIAINYLGKDAQSAFRHSALSSEDETSKLTSFAISIEENYYALGVPLLGYGHFAEDVHEAMKELFDQCKSEFTYTVIDLPHPLHAELTRKALSMSDLVLILVGNTEFAAEAAQKMRKLKDSDPKLKSVFGKECFVLNSYSNVKSILPTRLFLGSSTIFAVAIAYYGKTAVTIDPIIMGPLVLAFAATFLQGIMSAKHGQSSSGKNALKLLKADQIPIFHEIPNDEKTSRWAINFNKFFPEHTKIGNSLKGLSEKIRTKLGSAS